MGYDIPADHHGPLPSEVKQKMTNEKQTLLIIKGTIADMSPEHQQQIKEFYDTLHQQIKEHPIKALAIALIGAEIAALGD